MRFFMFDCRAGNNGIYGCIEMEQITQYLDYMWPDFVVWFAVILVIGLVVTFGIDFKQTLDKSDED